MPIHALPRSRRSASFMLAAALVALIAGPVADCFAEDSAILVKEGQKISFLGDSITANGFANPAGYVRLVIEGLKVNGVTAIPFPAGISGHTSKDMLARLQKDVISKKPDFMTLSCGVNDVWHANGIPLPQYKENITSIVTQAQAAGIKVVILTSTMILEDPGNDFNKRLAEYNDFLRELAKEKGCPVADLNADMQAGLKEDTTPAPHVNHYTVDGVHMNLLGQRMMASGVLKALGLNDAQLKKAQDSWLDIAGSVDILKASITIRQYDQLAALAQKKHLTVPDYIITLLPKLTEEASAAK